ncbi:unnamed protein product [Effrenium voratum]|uniref:Uncharacterized protein n=1 Tax=Effrenium voratum TaxID=2562239 RepID=A0AA36J753_9DINO|nr:unnamed protein product [Effrenium voratum]
MRNAGYPEASTWALEWQLRTLLGDAELQRHHRGLPELWMTSAIGLGMRNPEPSNTEADRLQHEARNLLREAGLQIDTKEDDATPGSRLTKAPSDTVTSQEEVSYREVLDTPSPEVQAAQVSDASLGRCPGLDALLRAAQEDLLEAAVEAARRGAEGR